MSLGRYRAVVGLVLVVGAITCFVVAQGADDGTVVHFATWIGGVVIGAAGIYLLVVAFPLPEIDTRPPDPKE